LHCQTYEISDSSKIEMKFLESYLLWAISYHHFTVSDLIIFHHDRLSRAMEIASSSGRKYVSRYGENSEEKRFGGWIKIIGLDYQMSSTISFVSSVPEIR
jgi:hypothetical protein